MGLIQEPLWQLNNNFVFLARYEAVVPVGFYIDHSKAIVPVCCLLWLLALSCFVLFAVLSLWPLESMWLCNHLAEEGVVGGVGASRLPFLWFIACSLSKLHAMLLTKLWLFPLWLSVGGSVLRINDSSLLNLFQTVGAWLSISMVGLTEVLLVVF